MHTETSWLSSAWLPESSAGGGWTCRALAGQCVRETPSTPCAESQNKSMEVTPHLDLRFRTWSKKSGRSSHSRYFWKDMWPTCTFSAWWCRKRWRIRAFGPSAAEYTWSCWAWRTGWRPAGEDAYCNWSTTATIWTTVQGKLNKNTEENNTTENKNTSQLYKETDLYSFEKTERVVTEKKVWVNIFWPGLIMNSTVTLVCELRAFGCKNMI